MTSDDGHTGRCASRPERPPRGDLRADERDELRRRVDTGYYLTPVVTWQVASRIVASGEL